MPSRWPPLLLAFVFVAAACPSTHSPETEVIRGSLPDEASVDEGAVAGVASPAPTPQHTVRFGAVGDIGDGSRVQRRVGDRIAVIHRQNPLDVLLLLGDMIYPNGNGALYEAHFAEPWRAVLDEDIRMEAALGNHDMETRRGADTMELFNMPGRYYSFTIGPATFYAIDSNRVEPAQTQWLREALAGSTTPWNILFMHAPMYSSGYHGSTGYLQRALDPIVREYGVQLVVAAHDHNYERTHPIGGTVYVTAGTGCCLRRVGSSGFTAVSLSEPGVAIVEVTRERATLEFVHSDGRVLDEAAIPVDIADREAAPAG